MSVPTAMSYDYDTNLADESVALLEEAIPLIPRVITSLEKQCEQQASKLDALGQEADKILKGLPTLFKILP